MLKFLLDSKTTIFLIILIYLSLSLFNINYPGLNTDEAINGVASSYIFKDVSMVPRESMQIVNCHVLLFGKIFPIMAGDYYGTVIPYLIYPFIRIFGPNAVSLRLSSIFILAIFLLFIYKLCKIWFGERVGLLAALLTATNLVFVQYGRVGLYRCEIFVAFFFWMGLFFLIKHFQIRRNLFLFLSFLFFGLGLSTKITFLYYIIALIVAYLVAGRGLGLLEHFNAKKTIIALLSFSLGASFMIIFNIKEPLKTFKLMFAVLAVPAATGLHAAGQGANNLFYFNNLGIRAIDLFNILKGNISARLDWGVTEISPVEIISPLITSMAVISLFSVFLFAFFSRNLTKIIKKRIIFFYIIYLTVFLLTPFTLSGFYQGHLLVLLPFPQVILALFLYYIWQRTKESRAVLSSWFYSFPVVLIILFNIWMNIHFNIQMKKTGGYGRWSTAIDELAAYLRENGIVSPVMFGYGLQANLMFLTGNKVIPVIYDKFYHRDIASAYRQLFSDNERIFYLTMTPKSDELEDFWVYRDEVRGKIALHKNVFMEFYKYFSGDQSEFHRDLFMKFIKESGKRKELTRVFINKTGLPVYWLYEIY